jgi:hypothetical protein
VPSFAKIKAQAATPVHKFELSRLAPARVFVNGREEDRWITLHLAPASISNKAFAAAEMRHDAARDQAKPRKRGGKHDEVAKMSAVEEAIAKARAIFAGTVIVGWDDVYDDAGVGVIYSEAACRELLEALPDDIVAEVIVEANTPDNFARVNATVVAGNS